MASIFTKAPKEAPYKQELLNTETSILKRLNSFIEETTNKWKSNNDWITKTGDQVNELLKRTFDLQRKVEGQIIDVENTAKKQFYDYDVKMQGLEDRLDGKYTTVLEHNEKIDLVTGLYRDLDSKVKKIPSDIKSVQNKIPTNVVKKEVLEELVSELRTNLTKVANAIPQNVASNDLVSDIRKEVIALFDNYPTTEALKSVQSGVESKIKKVADVSSATTRENKKTRGDFDKVAAKVVSIEGDYVSQKMLPSIEKKIKESAEASAKAIKSVQKEIPNDYAKQTELYILRESQKEIRSKFEEHKLEQNKSIATTMSNIESIMTRSTGKVEKEIKDFKKELAETTMGEDTNFMKNIVRDIADEEIKSLRNQSMLFQENVKNSMIEMKNQNRAMASKMTELQASFDKLIKLAQKK